MVSENFEANLVAKGFNATRVMLDCECIFLPISNDWREKVLNPKLNPRSKSIYIPEGRVKQTTYSRFFDALKQVDDPITGELDPNSKFSSLENFTSGPFKQNSMSDNSKEETIEVRVINIKSNPHKNKEFVMKFYRDKNHGILGKSLLDPNGPDYLIDFGDILSISHKELDRLDELVALCQFTKWNPNMKYPTARLLSTPTVASSLEAESIIMTTEFGVPLHMYSEETVNNIKNDLKDTGLFNPSSFDVCPPDVKDYRARKVICIESDYFENKEIAFSIQEPADDGSYDLSLYLPDVGEYFVPNSTLDLECRKRKMSYIPPNQDYKMPPETVYEAMRINSGKNTKALAIQTKVTGSDTIDLNKMVSVEACLIHPATMLSYKDCEVLLKGNEKDQNNLRNLIGKSMGNIEPSELTNLIKTIKELLKKLMRISENIENSNKALSPLQSVLYSDFMERESNERLKGPLNIPISKAVQQIDIIFSRMIATYLQRKCPELTLFKVFETPSAHTLEMLKEALECVGERIESELGFSDTAESYSALINHILSIPQKTKQKFLLLAVHCTFKDPKFETLEHLEERLTPAKYISYMHPVVSCMNPLQNYIDLLTVWLLSIVAKDRKPDETNFLSPEDIEDFCQSYNQTLPNINTGLQVLKDNYRYFKNPNKGASVVAEKTNMMIVKLGKIKVACYLESENWLRTIQLDRLGRIQQGPEGFSRIIKNDKKSKRKKGNDDDRRGGNGQNLKFVDLKPKEILDLKLSTSKDANQDLYFDVLM